MADSESELLTELHGYDGWTPDDTKLATLAVRGNCLRSAHEAASTKFWDAAQSSSNSSMTVRVFGPPGSATGTAAFLVLLRDEIRACLAKAVGRALGLLRE